jgi:cobalt-zinc-cadmium efflux system protein
MMAVAGAGLAVNLFVAWTLRGFARFDLNLRGAFLHVASDALASVAVLMGGAAIALTGWAPLDALVGMAIAVLILVNAFRLLRESLNLLLEGVPRHLRLDDVLAALSAVPGVVRVTDAHLWGLCSHLTTLSAHVTVEAAQASDPRRVLAEASAILKERFGIAHATLQIESAAWDSPRP